MDDIKSCVFEINLEPLKNRVSDIPLLVEYFSEKISTNYNLKKLKILSPIIKVRSCNTKTRETLVYCMRN